MSAQDNLSTKQFRLYHGTDAFLDVPGMVEPKLQGTDNRKDLIGTHVAFATTNLAGARTYGKNVYEVHPDEHTELLYKRDNNDDDYLSKKGFKIKSKVESRTSTFKRPTEM